MQPEELLAYIKNILLVLAKQNNIDLKNNKKLAVEKPKLEIYGDWSTNVALIYAKQFNVSAKNLADIFVKKMLDNEKIEKIDVAGPGFLNIILKRQARSSVVENILREKQNFGKSQFLKNENINLEFVSANPTGPIHIGGTRWAAVGDSLGNLLLSQGAKVIKEYYFNDHGAQIDNFVNSIIAKYYGTALQEDGYDGEYIKDLADKLMPELENRSKNEIYEQLKTKAVKLMFSQIKQSLQTFGTNFDIFFHENSLYKTGQVVKAVNELTARGFVYQKDSALWLKTSEFGDDKDRVLQKSTGEWTYFAADVAYYKNKRDRGFKTCVYMLGIDHHGYIKRLQAVAQAYGDTKENIKFLIGQFVNIIKDKKIIKLSKRAGNIITLDDLIKVVGVDAARYSLIRSSVNTPIDLDLDLITLHTNENPVYYVQYAYARCCNVMKNAYMLDKALSEKVLTKKADLSVLQKTVEKDLLTTLALYPAMLEASARSYEIHKVARYLEDLARKYHTFYSSLRILPNTKSEIQVEHIARLALNNATAQILKNALSLLGVSAPERM
ncbi:MAG: arginine--tRNA ligase [Bifidobacteriaceae bacterium]|jgi:arginyl-tRNA synthetase|nr:arginine--tRNA ligase [Bifidobacteriaceae bacterium]